MEKELFENLISLLAPEEIVKNFKIVSIKEKKIEIKIIFEEEENLVPKELEGKESVLDGFLNPLDLQTFPLKDKMVYLSLKRRRWKERGKPERSYYNTYNLHHEGMKATKEFGAFLKEELGLRPSEYNKLWESTKD